MIYWKIFQTKVILRWAGLVFVEFELLVPVELKLFKIPSETNKTIIVSFIDLFTKGVKNIKKGIILS